MSRSLKVEEFTPEDPASDRVPVRILIAALASTAAGVLTAATFEYMMVPIQTELGISVDGLTGLTLVPVAASLSVVFVVGALGDRFGLRRTMTTGVILYVIGAIMTMLSTSSTLLLMARGFSGVGGITLGILGLAALNQACRNSRERGRVFGYFAAIVPATFILGALVSAQITQSLGWRAVPVLWILVGACVFLLVQSAIPGSANERERRELVTPILAGVALSGVGIAATTYAGSPGISRGALTLALIALLVLVLIMRRMSNPTLDLRILQSRGAMVVVLAILLTTSVNFFFFINLFVQYRYALPLVQVSLLMAIPQLAAVIGGILGGRMSSWWTARTAAVVALAVCAVGTLGFTAIGPNSPVLLPVILLSAMAVPNAATVGPLTQVLLDRAPLGGSAAASAVRSAVWSLGGILGSITLGTLAFSAFARSLTNALEQSGLDLAQAQEIAGRVRAGEIVALIQQQLAKTAPVSSLELTGTTSGLGIARIDALHLVSIVGFAIYACAALLMLLLDLRARSRK